MFKRGLIASVPIVIGYIPVAITFGVSAVAIGFGRVEAVLASMLIFAGASQFALISLISKSFVDAVIIPIMLNLRHVVYGCIISQRINIRKPILTAFGLTDEVFATSLNANDEKFIWGLEVCAYLSWVLGTLIGVLCGAVLLSYTGFAPSLVFSLTALFFVLLISNIKGKMLAALVGGVTAFVFHYFGYTSMGILIAGLVTPIVVKVCQRITWQ